MNFRHGEIFICVSDFFPLHPFAGALDLRFAVEFFFSPLFFFFFFFHLPFPSGKKSNPGAMFNRDSSGQISFPVFDGRLTDESTVDIPSRVLNVE